MQLQLYIIPILMPIDVATSKCVGIGAVAVLIVQGQCFQCGGSVASPHLQIFSYFISFS